MPDVSKLDVDELPEVKQTRVRNSLLEERLIRKIKDLKLFKHSGKVNKFFRKAGEYSVKSKQRIKQHLAKRSLAREMEEVAKNGDEGKEQIIEKMLAEAEDLKRGEELEDAEKKYIDIIKLSPRSVEAYRGLGEVYVRERAWADTEATLEHLLKIASAEKKILADDFVELAEAKKNLDKMPEALHYVEKALELEPNNPKYLDFHLEACLACEELEKAKASLRNLRAVNPENNKLDEYLERIKSALH